MRGRADGAFEGPTANVADLLLHGARERYLLGGDADQVGLRDVPVRQARTRDGGDHALFDLRARPPYGELGQLRQVEIGDVHAAAHQMNAEDFDLFVFERQIDEKDFVEAAFADHFGGQRFDAIGGGGHE